jgi:drug/metabolite transporter (DMT)-like permease
VKIIKQGIILGTGFQVKFIGYERHVYLLLAAIAFFPQIIGHTVINWSLKFFSATTVSVIILAEPIGASILALLILDEKLSLMQILGGVTVIAGVLVVLLAEVRLKK